MNGTSLLIKRDLGETIFFDCEDSEETAICKSGSGFSPGTESAGNLILDFPASSTMRKTTSVV